MRKKSRKAAKLLLRDGIERGTRAAARSFIQSSQAEERPNIKKESHKAAKLLRHIYRPCIL